MDLIYLYVGYEIQVFLGQTDGEKYKDELCREGNAALLANYGNNPTFI